MHSIVYKSSRYHPERTIVILTWPDATQTHRRSVIKDREREEGVRKRETGAIYSNLTPDSVALNNRHRLRWDWSPFNNGLFSNELVLSVRNGPGRAGILPPVSRCCDSKELEINLGYNNFFCGPRPTTRINQISSFRASALAPRFFFLSHSRPRLDALCAFAPRCHPHPTSADASPSSFIPSFVVRYFLRAIALCVFGAICELNVYFYYQESP